MPKLSGLHKYFEFIIDKLSLNTPSCERAKAVTTRNGQDRNPGVTSVWLIIVIYLMNICRRERAKAVSRNIFMGSTSYYDIWFNYWILCFPFGDYGITLHSGRVSFRLKIHDLFDICLILHETVFLLSANRSFVIYVIDLRWRPLLLIIHCLVCWIRISLKALRIMLTGKWIWGSSLSSRRFGTYWTHRCPLLYLLSLHPRSISPSKSGRMTT